MAHIIGYCRFRNVRENLIFANICEYTRKEWEITLFANLLPCEFKVLANIENTSFYIAILDNRMLTREFMMT